MSVNGSVLFLVCAAALISAAEAKGEISSVLFEFLSAFFPLSGGYSGGSSYSGGRSYSGGGSYYGGSSYYGGGGGGSSLQINILRQQINKSVNSRRR